MWVKNFYELNLYFLYGARICFRQIWEENNDNRKQKIDQVQGRSQRGATGRPASSDKVLAPLVGMCDI